MPAGYIEFTADPQNRRTCPTCGETSDGSDFFGGPDPCLGRICGVVVACCGHGVRRELVGIGGIDTAYVELVTGQVYEGDDARRVFAQMGRPVPPLPAED